MENITIEKLVNNINIRTRCDMFKANNEDISWHQLIAGRVGGNLEIMGRAQKLLKRALAHEDFLKMQFKINKYEKNDFFLENVKWNVWHSDANLA